jgi:ATP-dependent helicase/nuclease subunit B
MDEPEAKAFWWPRFERIAAWIVGWDSERRANVARLDAEIRGKLSFDANGRSFTLRGRADRIELLKDGRYALIDFKTGVVPSTPQVETGLSPQMTLEGAILRQGGFGDIPSGAAIAELMHVKLSGTDPAGEPVPVKLAADEASDEALQRLKELVIAFENEDQPYQPMMLAMWATRYGAYDALSRVKEWSAAGGGGGE